MGYDIVQGSIIVSKISKGIERSTIDILHLSPLKDSLAGTTLNASPFENSI
jgi:hypothetical protein